MYKAILSELTSQQCKELLIETFGETNFKYHTLDEIPLYKLISKIPKSICPICKKEFIPGIDGGKLIEGKWTDLNCFWNSKGLT